MGEINYVCSGRGEGVVADCIQVKTEEGVIDKKEENTGL